jgi:hypothetical protein
VEAQCNNRVSESYEQSRDFSTSAGEQLKGRTSMTKFGRFYPNLNHTCLVVLLAAVLLSVAACVTTSTPSSDAPQLMFVQSAKDLKVDLASNTLRLVKVNQQTLYFTDRPQRIAEHLKMVDYLKEWTAQAGKDNFGEDPPNATLSVYESGQPDNTVVVVEIANPVVDGEDLIYSYKILNGTMPANVGPTALFIDWIGVGGGVGRGFHGVGVGRRGRGVY